MSGITAPRDHLTPQALMVTAVIPRASIDAVCPRDSPALEDRRH